MKIERWPLISFGLFVIILIIKIVWLQRKGIRPNSQKTHNNPINLWMRLLFFFLIMIWLFEVIRPALKLEFSLLPTKLTTFLFSIKSLQIGGAILILFALILLGITLVNFESSLRFGLDKNNRGKLISSGIFAHSRNPFFLSIDIYVVGISMVLPSLFFLIFATTTIVSIHFFVLKEERFLAENYGEEYREYRQKTRRYF